MRRTLAILAVAAIAALMIVPAAIVTADTAPEENKGEEGWGHHGPQWRDGGGYNDDDNVTSDHDFIDLNETMERGRVHGLMGHGTYVNGYLNGSFVSFTFDNETGALENFSLRTASGLIEVFASVTVDGLSGGNVTSFGSLLIITGNEVQVIVHDNPTGMIHVVTNTSISNITYHLADGFQVVGFESALNNCSLGSRALINNGRVTGIIASGNGTMTYGNDSGYWVNVQGETELAMSRFAPAFKLGDHMHDEEVMDAISHNRLGAEMSMICGDNGVSYDTMEYHPDMSLSLVQGKKGHVELQVTSSVHTGRAVLINLDSQSMEGDMRVLLDGKQVRLANSTAEVLYASGQGSSDACYYVTEQDNASSVVLYVPSFSTHSIVIESSLAAPEITTTSGALIVVAAAAVAIGAGVLLFRKK
jgi:hypothetical protein